MIDNRQILFSLAQRFGTPLYAYDLDEVERRRDELAAILPTGASLLYSLKANPFPAIGCVLSPSCAAEVSSEGELCDALDAGFDRARILYTGPGKTERDLRHALAEGVRYFSGESWVDVARLARVSAELGQRPRVLLRVNPAPVGRAKLSMAGSASPFGFDEASLLAAPNDWHDYADRIELLGIHVYAGTQLRDAAALEASFRAAFVTAERLAARLGIALRVVDVGGGFPWPYATLDPATRLDELRQPLAQLCASPATDSEREVWFESGRYLCASAGTLIATVLDVKQSSNGRRQVVLDAGINVLGGMSGLGRVLASPITVMPLSDGGLDECGVADVVGPLCTPLDVLSRNVVLPPVVPGDLVAIPNVGAYGLSASLVAFLGRPAPIEVAHRAGEIVAAQQLDLRRRDVL